MTIYPENTGLLADIFMDRFGDKFLYVQTKHYKQFVMLEDGVWVEDAHGEFHKHVIELSHIAAQIIELHVPDAPVLNTFNSVHDYHEAEKRWKKEVRHADTLHKNLLLQSRMSAGIGAIESELKKRLGISLNDFEELPHKSYLWMK